MATQDFKRKLTAILSADVKGYSRLMGEDDQATVRTIEHDKASGINQISCLQPQSYKKCKLRN